MIGTVLVVTIIVIAMALVASVVLGNNFYNQSPEAEIAYNEETDSVSMALEKAYGMSAEDTEIGLAREGDCGPWGGSGNLEKGDVTTVNSSDCPKELEDGDVIQVISGGVLLDTDELRGVSPKFNRCEDRWEDGDLELAEGETLECDIVGEDGGLVDVDATIKPGAELDGMVRVSEDGSIEVDNGTITGDVDSEDLPAIKEDSEIGGDIEILSNGTGDTVTIKEGGVIQGSITAPGEKVKLEADSEVVGSIQTAGYQVELVDATVRGDILVTEDDKNGNSLNDGVVLKDSDSGSLVEGDVNTTVYNIDIEGDSEIEGETVQNTDD